MNGDKKGIVLAGGTGTRLGPLSTAQSKQLLPVYDKPMIYYPIATLMTAGIRDICIVVNPGELENFTKLLGNGENFGLNISYIIQQKPEGIAQAFTLTNKFLNGHPACLVLGDNLFVGAGLGTQLSQIKVDNGAHILLYEVENPTAYGNVLLNSEGTILEIVEKPLKPRSKFAIPGIYFVDGSAAERASQLSKSPRGEYEITDLLNLYLDEKLLRSTTLSRGTAWLDTGNPEDLFAAGELVRIYQKRQGLYIGCLEEIALRNNWISFEQLEKIHSSPKSAYSRYVLSLRDCE